MLYFVTTETDEEGTDFWIALASNEEQCRDMFEDQYTKIIEISSDVVGNLIEQYGGLARLCTL